MQKKNIQKGQWINQYLVNLPTAPDIRNMEYGTNIVRKLPEPPIKTWWGYPNPNGGFAGTRNVLGIMTTVQCVAGVGKIALEKIPEDLIRDQSDKRISDEVK